MPNVGKCAGEEFAAISGIVILSSYLLLFISFYLATYRKDGKKPSGRKSLRKMSQAPLPDPHLLLGGSLSNGKARASGAKTNGAKTNGTSTRSRKA